MSNERVDGWKQDGEWALFAQVVRGALRGALRRVGSLRVTAGRMTPVWDAGAAPLAAVWAPGGRAKGAPVVVRFSVQVGRQWEVVGERGVTGAERRRISGKPPRRPAPPTAEPTSPEWVLVALAPRDLRSNWPRR